jgi:hypothetical protein
MTHARSHTIRRGPTSRCASPAAARGGLSPPWGYHDTGGPPRERVPRGRRGRCGEDSARAVRHRRSCHVPPRSCMVWARAPSAPPMQCAPTAQPARRAGSGLPWRGSRLLAWPWRQDTLAGDGSTRGSGHAWPGEVPWGSSTRAAEVTSATGHHRAADCTGRGRRPVNGRRATEEERTSWISDYRTRPRW